MEPTLQNMRILNKGKIEDLKNGFHLESNAPFSVFVREKNLPTMETSVLAKCKLMCDQEIGDFPLPVGDWTPAAIKYLAPNAIDLTKYDVYWGAGNINNN